MSKPSHNRTNEYRQSLSRLRSRGSGFTLIELLVVIAVITILVAVLVPVTMQSRNRARSVVCLSNLRQQSFAILAYSQDWNDKLPALSATPFAGSLPSIDWPEGSSGTQLRDAIASYVKDSAVHLCGNDTGSPEFGFDPSQGPVCRRAGSSYLPWSAARVGQYGVVVNGERLSSLSDPSGQALIRDYGSTWHGFRTRRGLDVVALTVANSAFADGHAAAVPVYTVAIGGRRYSCWATTKNESSGYVFVSGGSGDVEAELSGTHGVATGDQTTLRLSGTVSGGGSLHNVDRVFVFGPDASMDAKFRQVAAWADALVAR